MVAGGHLAALGARVMSVVYALTVAVAVRVTSAVAADHLVSLLSLEVQAGVAAATFTQR